MELQLETHPVVQARTAALRQQIAVVRALLDDLTRIAPSAAADATDQLGEELIRLGRHAQDVAAQLTSVELRLRKCAVREPSESYDPGEARDDGMASQPATSGVFLSRRTA